MAPRSRPAPHVAHPHGRDAGAGSGAGAGAAGLSAPGGGGHDGHTLTTPTVRRASTVNVAEITERGRIILVINDDDTSSQGERGCVAGAGRHAGRDALPSPAHDCHNADRQHSPAGQRAPRSRREAAPMFPLKSPSVRPFLGAYGRAVVAAIAKRRLAAQRRNLSDSSAMADPSSGTRTVPHAQGAPPASCRDPVPMFSRNSMSVRPCLGAHGRAVVAAIAERRRAAQRAALSRSPSPTSSEGPKSNASSPWSSPSSSSSQRYDGSSSSTDDSIADADVAPSSVRRSSSSSDLSPDPAHRLIVTMAPATRRPDAVGALLQRRHPPDTATGLLHLTLHDRRGDAHPSDEMLHHIASTSWPVTR